MKTVLVTASASSNGFCLASSEIKVHLRLPTSSTGENSLLSGLRDAAQNVTENYINRKLTTQTWKIYFDEFPSEQAFEIPYPPLVSVPSTGIKYTLSSGGSTTFSSTKWNQDIVSEPGRVVLGYNDDWPSNTLETNNPIEILFNCGYKSTNRPQAIKQALLLMIGSWYENREEIIVSGQSFQKMPIGTKSLLDPYRIFRF